jgi:hypothetical protein
VSAGSLIGREDLISRFGTGSRRAQAILNKLGELGYLYSLPD